MPWNVPIGRPFKEQRYEPLKNVRFSTFLKMQFKAITEQGGHYKLGNIENNEFVESHDGGLFSVVKIVFDNKPDEIIRLKNYRNYFEQRGGWKE